MKSDAEGAKGKLEDRKIIDRAKGILMDTYGIPENEAYNRIRKLSMDKRCTMKQIASAIITDN